MGAFLRALFDFPHHAFSLSLSLSVSLSLSILPLLLLPLLPGDGASTSLPLRLGASPTRKGSVFARYSGSQQKAERYGVMACQWGPCTTSPKLVKPPIRQRFHDQTPDRAQGRASLPGGGVPASLSSFPLGRRREGESEREFSFALFSLFSLCVVLVCCAVMQCGHVSHVHFARRHVLSRMFTLQYMWCHRW